MELKWLEDLLVLFEEGSFTKAAERRNVTQPAFSRRIQSLEDWLETTIVDRSTQPITILESAWRLQPEIKALAQRTRELRKRFMVASQNMHRLDFVTQHTLAISVFPDVMRIINENSSQISYRLRSANMEECITTILRGDADFFLGYNAESYQTEIPEALFKKIAWGTDRLIPVVGGSLKYGLDEKGRLASPIPFLSYPEKSFLGKVVSSTVLPNLTSEYNVEWRCEAAFSFSIKAMCVNGMGLAWLPSSMVWRDLEAGSLVSLGPWLECKDISVVIYGKKSDTFAMNILSLLELSSRRIVDV